MRVPSAKLGLAGGPSCAGQTGLPGSDSRARDKAWDQETRLRTSMVGTVCGQRVSLHRPGVGEGKAGAGEQQLDSGGGSPSVLSCGCAGNLGPGPGSSAHTSPRAERPRLGPASWLPAAPRRASGRRALPQLKACPGTLAGGGQDGLAQWQKATPAQPPSGASGRRCPPQPSVPSTSPKHCPWYHPPPPQKRSCRKGPCSQEQARLEVGPGDARELTAAFPSRSE